MALGAVATGSMNAQLALIAAGIMIFIGSIPMAPDTEKSMGIMMAVVAVLLVISVRKVMVKQMVKIMKNK